jgi:hypothetical protein
VVVVVAVEDDEAMTAAGGRSDTLLVEVGAVAGCDAAHEGGAMLVSGRSEGGTRPPSLWVRPSGGFSAGKSVIECCLGGVAPAGGAGTGSGEDPQENQEESQEDDGGAELAEALWLSASALEM